MEWYRSGERVRIIPGDHLGTVCGHGATEAFTARPRMPIDTENEPMVLVCLDHGFYKEDSTLFVRILVCHPDTLARA